MAKGDKGKFTKRGGRGGGSRFQATSADEIEARNSRIAEFDEKRAKRRDDAENEGGEAEVEEAAKGVSDLGVGVNVNRAAEEIPKTRREREQEDKERKAADYRRRHELGLTDEFKRDMSKLNEVKKRREDAEKRAKAEAEADGSLEAERQAALKAATAAAALEDSDSDDDKKKSKKGKKKGEVPKLDKLKVKKMKPAQLKEALKERGCDIQGNAKTLTARLLEFEANR
jgi:hypothetical protein|eukprot:scaffold978_cov230-Chaetoceros_neogracile.AAC.20